MAIRIQLRRDISSNWTTNNPILLPGEIGVETDTLKFKIGNGSRWNATSSYAFKLGEANGVATLGPTGKILTSQLPDSISMDAELTAALSELTTSTISEGSNKYFTNQRAIDATASAISNAISTASIDATNKANNAKSEAIASAMLDATNKANAAQAAAIAAAEESAALADTITIELAISAASEDTDLKIASEITNRNNAINTAISNEITNRNTAIQSEINSLTTSDIPEGNSQYFTSGRVLSVTEGLYDPIGSSSNALSSAIEYTDALGSNIGNSLGDYVLEADRNNPSGFAGLNLSGKLLDSVIPDSVSAYTDQKIAQLIDSAPSTLDTLSEIATALQDDQSAAAALTILVGTKISESDAAATYETISNVALKAPIHSPTFTGTVSGITKSMVGLSNIDNTSDLDKPISTAAQSALDLKLNKVASIVYSNSSYTVGLSDLFKIIEMSGGGTLTISDSSSIPVGSSIEVLQTGDSQVTIAGNGFVPNSTPGLKLRTKWSSATLLKRDLNSWVVLGDLSA